MSYEEFKKTVFHTANKIIIPLLHRPSIDKINFFRNGKYNYNLEEEWLQNFYKKNKERLI